MKIEQNELTAPDNPFCGRIELNRAVVSGPLRAITPRDEKAARNHKAKRQNTWPNPKPGAISTSSEKLLSGLNRTTS